MDPKPNIIWSSDEEDTAKNVENTEHKSTPGETPQVESPEFNGILSGITTNKLLTEQQKFDWKNYFVEKLEVLEWPNSVLMCHVFKEESDYLNISYADLWSLIDAKGCLSDSIINAVLNYYCKDSDNIGYIGTSVLKSIEKNRPVDTPLKDDKDGYLAVKNAGGDNWVVVYLSLKDKALYVVDPKHNRTENWMRQIFDSLVSCHHSVKNSKNASKWDLSSGDWEMKQIDCTQQTDSHSYVILCIEFAFLVMASRGGTPEMLHYDHFDAGFCRVMYLSFILGHSKKFA